MKNSKKWSIDKVFQEHLGKAKYTYDPKAWQQAEKLLDQKRHRPAYGGWWLNTHFAGVVLAIAALFGGFSPLFLGEDTPTEPTTLSTYAAKDAASHQNTTGLENQSGNEQPTSQQAISDEDANPSGNILDTASPHVANSTTSTDAQQIAQADAPLFSQESMIQPSGTNTKDDRHSPPLQLAIAPRSATTNNEASQNTAAVTANESAQSENASESSSTTTETAATKVSTEMAKNFQAQERSTTESANESAANKAAMQFAFSLNKRKGTTHTPEGLWIEGLPDQLNTRNGILPIAPSSFPSPGNAAIYTLGIVGQFNHFQKTAVQDDNAWLQKRALAESPLSQLGYGVQFSRMGKQLTWRTGLNYTRYQERVQYHVERTDYTYETTFRRISTGHPVNGGNVWLVEKNTDTIANTVKVDSLNQAFSNQLQFIELPFYVGKSFHHGPWFADAGISLRYRFAFGMDGKTLNQSQDAFQALQSQYARHSVQAGLGINCLYQLPGKWFVGAHVDYLPAQSFLHFDPQFNWQQWQFGLSLSRSL